MPNPLKRPPLPKIFAQVQRIDRYGPNPDDPDGPAIILETIWETWQSHRLIHRSGDEAAARREADRRNVSVRQVLAAERVKRERPDAPPQR